MRDDDSDEFKPDTAKMSLTITVSLFMSVLAFFIVLNSYSTESASKMMSLRNSLVNAFGFAGMGMAAVSNDENGMGIVGQMEEDFAAGLRSILPDLVFKTRRTSRGSIMSATIPRSVFEDEWDSFRTRLGDLIVNRARGNRCDLQIIYLNGEAGAKTIASYATDLVDEGVDAARIMTGYEKRGLDAVEIKFTLSKGRF